MAEERAPQISGEMRREGKLRGKERAGPDWVCGAGEKEKGRVGEGEAEMESGKGTAVMRGGEEGG